MTRKEQKWTLWSIEAWGNADDGWEFNDRSRSLEFECDISMYADADAIKTLCEKIDELREWHFAEALKDGRIRAEWEGETTVGIYDMATDEPLYTIEADEYVL